MFHFILPAATVTGTLIFHINITDHFEIIIQNQYTHFKVCLDLKMRQQLYENNFNQIFPHMI